MTWMPYAGVSKIRISEHEVEKIRIAEPLVLQNERLCNSNFFNLRFTNLNFQQFEKLTNLNLKASPLRFELVSLDCIYPVKSLLPYLICWNIGRYFQIQFLQAKHLLELQYTLRLLMLIRCWKMASPAFYACWNSMKTILRLANQHLLPLLMPQFEPTQLVK